jgi:8-oxo-dGTP pyrophosphatase MutT (NUDIX family)
MTAATRQKPMFSASDLRRRALERLPAEPPLRTLPSGVIPGGDHALNQRGLSREAVTSARAAAVLVPIVAHEDGATVLLTQRNSTLRKHSGQVAFPGGKIDEPGETEIEAALRETEEEIGLARAHVEPVGFLDPYFTGTGFRIVPVVGIVTPPFDLTINPDEVDAAFEVPLDFLMAPENHQRIERETDGRRFYAMPYGERYIWGATAGMIRHLYERLYL